MEPQEILLDDAGVPVPGGHESHFQTTHWTLVLQAAQEENPQGRDALAQLCQIYWYPLYAYVRRRGYNQQDAEDLVQSFFARFLEKRCLEGICEAGGKFRAYLLTVLKNFLTNEWARGQAQKRGGGLALISLDAQDAEGRYRMEPVDYETPEVLYERRWAITLLDNVLNRLAQEFARNHKPEVFEILKPCIMGEGVRPYSEIAEQLNATENALKVIIHRLRSRFRALVHDAVRQTVSNTSEVEGELRALLDVFGTK